MLTGMPRIGLVLGAGGLAGEAFHAGVLRALESTTGWSATRSDVIVGTSVGAWVGSYLRNGITGTDLAAHMTGQPVRAQSAEKFARLGVFEAPSPNGNGNGARVWPSVPAPRHLARVARAPWRARPEVLLVAAWPKGHAPTDGWIPGLRRLVGHEWPAAPLWIPAVCLADGRRVVFGRDGAPKTELPLAVAASSAIPGLFRPVSIDEQPYVDGAAHSQTNADLLRREALDVVVVSAPMATASLLMPASMENTMRMLFRARLGQEVRALRDAGTKVIVFQPDESDQVAMGTIGNEMSRAAPVVHKIEAAVLSRLERSEGKSAEAVAALAS
jgi:NTE family protein